MTAWATLGPPWLSFRAQARALTSLCISTEDLLHVSEPVRQELKKLLIKQRLEKKSVLTAAEAEPGEGASV